MVSRLRGFLAGLLALPAAAVASEFSYSNAEVRLVAQDPEGGDAADGVAFGGSFDLGPQLFVNGGYSTVSSGGFRGVDTDVLDAGMGLHHPLSSRVDLFGIAGLVSIDVSTPGRDEDDLGPTLTGGVRAWITPRVEMGGFAQYLEVFGDGDVSIHGEALYHFSRQIAAIGGLGASDDDRSVSAGVRWYFPGSYDR